MTGGSLIDMLREGFYGGTCVSFALALILTAKSLKDFSHTGPQLRKAIHEHFRMYAVFATVRLTFWSFVILAAMSTLGMLIYICTVVVLDRTFSLVGSIVASMLAIALLTALQFSRHLLYLPASIAASYHYRQSRLYPLWRVLTPGRLQAASAAALAAIIAPLLVTAFTFYLHGDAVCGALIVALSIIFMVLAYRLFRPYEPRPMSGKRPRSPNILMIGSDTLRADRLGSAGYHRDLTPFIDSLARRGVQFTACYVPCARTAPSLLSLHTGTWPHTHGIRDNFVADAETRLKVAKLPEILSKHGYRTAAVSDWSGGDLRKFSLGFEHLDLPEDQWNIKYLIRQGPKDLRLFLSLFTHNRFGKWVLPELYYLAGVPLTSLVGRDARALISRFAAQGDPFFLNVFVSTTHPPFGSEYPYYTLWSDKDYVGESKFVMARLTDPWEIIRRQGDTKRDFDIDQVIDLYDGCVRNFDDEVKRIVEHVKACGLENETIVVIYSDHGMEFFEHDTWGQGNTVRSEFSPRIPLAIVDPRASGRGQRSQVVRSIDVAPTLLELVGISAPIGMDGVSLAPYLTDNGTDLNLAAFNETGIWLTDLPGMPKNHLRYPNLMEILEVPDKVRGTLAIKQEYKDVVVTAKDRMMCVGSWKLTYQPTTNGPIYALFNLADDPTCRRDVAALHPDIFRELRGRLADWMSEHNRAS